MTSPTTTLLAALHARKVAQEARAVVAEGERVAREAAQRHEKAAESDADGEMDPECHQWDSRAQRAKNEGEA